MLLSALLAYPRLFRLGANLPPKLYIDMSNFCAKKCQWILSLEMQFVILLWILTYFETICTFILAFLNA